MYFFSTCQIAQFKATICRRVSVSTKHHRHVDFAHFAPSPIPDMSRPFDYASLHLSRGLRPIEQSQNFFVCEQAHTKKFGSVLHGSLLSRKLATLKQCSNICAYSQNWAKISYRLLVFVWHGHHLQIVILLLCNLTSAI